MNLKTGHSQDANEARLGGGGCTSVGLAYQRLRQKDWYQVRVRLSYRARPGLEEEEKIISSNKSRISQQ